MRKIGTFIITASIAIGTVTATVPLNGCTAGQTARDNVLEPALEAVAPAVRADAERGLAATNIDGGQAAIDQVFMVISVGDHEAAAPIIATQWPIVRELAYAGIADRFAQGELGTMAVGSFENRVDEFGNALHQWVGVDP